MVDGQQNLNGSWHDHAPFRDGLLRPPIYQIWSLYLQFSTYYEDMKSDTKC